MFGFLSRWFGTAPKPAEKSRDADPPPRPPTATPDVAAERAPVSSHFICREAVLDRNEHIAGYEFSLSRRVQARLLDRSQAGQRAYDDGLLRNLDTAGIAALASTRTTFVHLFAASLNNPLIERLAGPSTVFLVDAGAAAPDGGLGAQLAALRGRGGRYGLCLNGPAEQQMPLFATADFVEVDSAAFDGVELRELPRRLHSLRPRELPPLALIARELATFDDFQVCFKSGFDFFQGPFVSSRENWRPPKSEINRLRVLQLLNLIRGGADSAAIADALKTEPVLTYKLLRYINSPAMGIGREVTTITQALLVLGRDKFYRWLSLLLFDIQTPGYRERLLTEQALARGRIMENLAGQGSIPNAAEPLFLCGLFSLLDRLMGMPLPALFEQVTLPEAVRAALLGSPSPLQGALALAIACEADDPAAIAEKAATCGVDGVAMSQATLRALNWVQQLTGGSGD